MGADEDAAGRQRVEHLGDHGCRIGHEVQHGRAPDQVVAAAYAVRGQVAAQGGEAVGQAGLAGVVRRHGHGLGPVEDAGLQRGLLAQQGQRDPAGAAAQVQHAARGACLGNLLQQVQRGRHADGALLLADLGARGGGPAFCIARGQGGAAGRAVPGRAVLDQAAQQRGGVAQRAQAEQPGRAAGLGRCAVQVAQRIGGQQVAHGLVLAAPQEAHAPQQFQPMGGIGLVPALGQGQLGRRLGRGQPVQRPRFEGQHQGLGLDRGGGQVPQRLQGVRGGVGRGFTAGCIHRKVLFTKGSHMRQVSRTPNSRGGL